MVNETLHGRDQEIKGLTIAQAVYGDLDANVAEGARQVRRKLAQYYANDGRVDPWEIEIATGTYVPTFRPKPPPPPEKALRLRHLAFIVRLVLIALITSAILMWRVSIHNAQGGVKIKIDSKGDKVTPFANVTVEGWRPNVNQYLMVEPLDYTKQKWVQFKITGPEINGTVQFGEAKTQSGTRFRVYVLYTKSKLPEGKLAIEPEAATESPAVIVTLQK